MYQSILVPVSFEEDRDSVGALTVAQALCAPGGQITLLHVMEHVPAYAGEFLPPDFHTRQVAEITDRLTAMAADIAGAKVAVVEGHASRTILEHARAGGADCIIVASHRPGMQDLLLGSTAAKVVRHAPCSVHVLR